MATEPHQPPRRRDFGMWLPTRDPERLDHGDRVRLRYDHGELAGTVILGRLLASPRRAAHAVLLYGDDATTVRLPWPHHFDHWKDPER